MKLKVINFNVLTRPIRQCNRAKTDTLHSSKVQKKEAADLTSHLTIIYP